MAPEIGRLLDEAPPLAGPERQHLVDEPLRHHGVAVLADLGAAEEVEHVAEPDALPVDAVIVLARAVGAARDGDLAVLDGHPALGVVEGQRDLGRAQRAPLVGAAEDDVLGAARADLAGRLLSERPADRVRDVRLAGAVGADHDGDAGPELEALAVGEGLEAVQLERAQVHISSPPPAGRGGRAVPRAPPPSPPAACSTRSRCRPAHRRGAPRPRSSARAPAPPRR